MTHLLPPNLLALFTPRPALRYVEPSDCPQELRRTAKITGVAEYMNALKEDTGGHAWTESALERKDRIKDEAREQRHKQLTEGIAQYKPKEDPNSGGYDPFKTLFVYRLSYRATVNDLEKAFNQYGRVVRVKIPVGLGKKDTKVKHKGRSRGYAFVVFDHESDMREAYRRSQGLMIHGRTVAVDVERSHTVQNWKPRRLGGGVGPGRVSGLPKMSDRFARAPSGPGRGGFGGFRGGRGDFRGDFRGGRGGFRGGRGDFRGGPPSGPRGGDFDRRGANYEPVQPRGSYRERGGERGGYEDRSRYDDRRRDGPRFDDRRRDDRPRW